MRHNDWPRLAGLASFALLAIGCAAFLMASGDIAKSVAGAGLLLLAAGQIVFMIASWLRQSRMSERQALHAKSLRELSEQVRATAGRLQQMEEKPAEPPQSLPMPAPQRQSSALEEMQLLRQQLQSLANEIQKPFRQESPESAPLPKQQSPEPAPPAKKETRPAANERLDLLLEPVIELSNGETAHYRALLSMVDAAGSEVAHAELMRRAEQEKARPTLDLHLLGLALPVFRRLRSKHPVMRLFMPVGASTLTSAADLGRLLSHLEAARDIAAGVVLEITHSDLASLGAPGIEGLAQLGRLGATMALSRVSLAGLDLTSLRQLGVRFLDIDARGFEGGFGVAPAWNDFIQFARSMQFQIVAGHVEEPAQSLAAGRLARYGYGPYFAPSRRVRANAGQTAPASHFQAA